MNWIYVTLHISLVISVRVCPFIYVVFVCAFFLSNFRNSNSQSVFTWWASNPYFGVRSKITSILTRKMHSNVLRKFKFCFFPSFFLPLFLLYGRTKWPSAVIIRRIQFLILYTIRVNSSKFSLLMSIVRCDAPSHAGSLLQVYEWMFRMYSEDGWIELCYVIHLCLPRVCVCLCACKCTCRFS